MGLICFKCDEVILKTDKRMMIPIEVPYLNLYMHRHCYDEIEDLSTFLTQNLPKLYNRSIESNKKGKNG